MDNLTDLEICEAMAKIDESFNKIYMTALASYHGGTISLEKACEVSIASSLSIRYEYNVIINYLENISYIFDFNGVSIVHFEEQKDIHRAVCLTIIEAYGKDGGVKGE